MGPKRSRRFKLNITPYPMKPEDREMLMQQYRHVREIHQAAKKAPKDLKRLFQNELQTIRNDLLNNYAHKFFMATIQLGPHKQKEIFPFYPGLGLSGRTEEIKMLRDQLVKRLAVQRKGTKEMFREIREFNGMQYPMIGGRNPYDKIKVAVSKDAPPKQSEPKKIMGSLLGGGRVFEQGGSILKLLEGPEYVNRINRAKRPYDKNNYVGVELELICALPIEELRKKFIDAKLAGYVYIVRDGSIRAEKDGDFTHEVTLIAKQTVINDVVSRVCKVLTGPDVKGYVNNSCGLHVHLDMRNRKPDICYKNLYYSLGMLAGMVPADRVESDWGKRYCSLNNSPEWGSGGTSDLGRRYSAINCEAFNKHKTIEIRLHSGSLNATKINNWVNILTAIVDRADAVGKTITSAKGLQEQFGINDTLVEYINTRTEKFTKDRKIDTRKDHFETAI